MKSLSVLLSSLAMVLLAMPVQAVTWTATDVSPTGAEACVGGDLCKFTVPNASGAAVFKAYSNSAWMPSDLGGVAPVGSGAGNFKDGPASYGGGTQASTGWVEARNNFYGSTSGFGIKNDIQNAVTEEDVSPEHATDNKEVLDIMVIELPKITGETWDLTSFALGWANENGLSQADVSMFIGGSGLSSNYDFRGVCFDTGATSLGSCGAGQKALSTLGGGFTNITSAIANSGNNVQGNGLGTTVTTNATGNYIIMAGRLGDSDDAFKLKSISATSVPGGPPGAPEPGTLALLGLGLVGLARSRRAAKART